MSQRPATPTDFTWTGDVSRGAWLADRLDGDHGDRVDPVTGEPRPALSHVVPSGFAALIRVLHPFARARPATGTWAAYRDAIEAGDPENWPEQVSEDVVRWRTVAESLGRKYTPGVLSHELLGVEYGEHPEGESADGWEYEPPLLGMPDEREFVEILSILAEHTGTPDAGIAAVWEGFGGLVSAQGVGFFFGYTDEEEKRGPRWWRSAVAVVRVRRAEFREFRGRYGTGPAIRNLLQKSLTWRWGRHALALAPSAFAQRPGSGLLTREAAAGPRLELPDRAYVCFEAGARDLADPAWPVRAPWTDAGVSFGTGLPNLIWPEGRGWVLVSEIDFDSTLVACSRACADALLASDAFDAVEITRDTPLWSTAP